MSDSQSNKIQSSNNANNGRKSNSGLLFAVSAAAALAGALLGAAVGSAISSKDDERTRRREAFVSWFLLYCLMESGRMLWESHCLVHSTWPHTFHLGMLIAFFLRRM